MARSILLTRPTKQSKYFARQLTKIGVKEPILIAPLISIIFKENYKINFPEIKKFIVTSANAIEGVNANRILSSHIRENKTPIYCVGERTTQIGKDYGYYTIYCGSTVSHLLKKLRVELMSVHSGFLPMQICYLRGEKITLDLAKLLSVREVVIYSQNQNLIDDKIKEKLILGDIGHIFFFSKNTVDLFFDKIDDIKPITNVFCFSEKIRNKVLERIGYEKENVYFPERPISSEMINLFLSKK